MNGGKERRRDEGKEGRMEGWKDGGGSRAVFQQENERERGFFCWVGVSVGGVGFVFSFFDAA